MKVSNTKIDKAGNALSKGRYKDELDYIRLEDIFDEYRMRHLKPLTNTTISLQSFLGNFDKEYYIAQRLKRKPQIIRKLQRLSVRLSQLQDIGGCRIIVKHNSDVDDLQRFLKHYIDKSDSLNITRETDYRELGRDDTGYRALHIIFSVDNYNIELQIRSRIQHYWAESIERTSIIYGYHLKEKEGAPEIIQYFKKLSDVFYEIESGREPSIESRLEIDTLRETCESIIVNSDERKIFDSYVDDNIIKTLSEIEKNNKHGINNWILIFDWNEGSFVSWDIVSRDPEEAVKEYIRYEETFPANIGYEVVLIGSSEIATVRQTHSHYFGIDTYDNILESLDTSIVGFYRKIDIDVGARKILATMHRRRFWGGKSISMDTLKNHFCKDVLTFDSSIQTLIEKELVIPPHGNSGVSLNIRKKKKIEQYL